MLFVLLGLGVGLSLALAAHPLAFLIGPVDAACSWLLSAGHRVADAALGHLGLDPGGVPAQVLAAVIAVALPGLVCLALAFAARATLSARRALSGLLLAAALASFAVLPAGQALVLCVLAFAAAGPLALAAGALVTAPVVAVGTVLGARTVAVVLGGHSRALADGAATLAKLSGVDPAVWRLALVLVALAPLSGALRVLLRNR